MSYAAVARKLWSTSSDTAATTPTTTPTTTAKPSASSGILSQTADSPYVFGLPTGYTQKDTGDGRYEMFDPTGQSAGYGYKGVQDAIEEIGYNNAAKNSYEKDGKYYNPLFSAARSVWQDASGNEVNSAPNGEGGTMSPEYAEGYTQNTLNEHTGYNSQDELNNALRGYVDYKPQGGGIIGDWETLGQVLGGAVKPEVKTEGYMTNSGVGEDIKGANALYGSTPVFSKEEDGKYSLLGYRTDLTPGQAYDGGDTQWTDSSVTAKHNGDKLKWNSNVWRELNNPEEWGKAAVVGQDGTAFIPKEAVDAVPGWQNKDSYDYQQIKKGLVQRVWEKTSPTHLVLNKDFEDVAPIGEVVGNVIGMYFTGVPIGSLLMATDNASKGEGNAAGASLINAVASYAGANMGELTSGMSAAGQAATQAATSAAIAGAGTYVITGDSKKAFNAALGGALAGAVSGYFSGSGDTLKSITGWSSNNEALDKIIMKAGMGAVKSAISAGAQGADIGDAFTRAATSAVSTLIGEGTTAQTGSSVAGSMAGAAAGTLLNNATKDQPAGSSPASTTTTTAAKPATSSTSGYASIARKLWSATNA